MTPEQFCYWLAGALELSSPETLDKGQVDLIRDMLDYVLEPEDRFVDEREKAWEKIALDPNKSVNELMAAGLIKRGLAKNVAAHVPDTRPVQGELFPIEHFAGRSPTDKVVPRWPDETTYDPEKTILENGGQVIDIRSLVAGMATEVSNNR